MRLLPEAVIRSVSANGIWAGNPFLCFVLHRMGFFVRLRLREIRWALTPPFHPYHPKPEPDRALGDGIFSVTLSVSQGLRPESPRFLRDMLPFGVRTFLWSDSRQASDRPHAADLRPISEKCKETLLPKKICVFSEICG
jgi:hypothetical protein